MKQKFILGINGLRRRIAQRFDQAIALTHKKFFLKSNSVQFDGQTRFALVTVNYSTTHYLKLMLLTLTQQNNLEKLKRIIIVDNNSKDGGVLFLNKLTKKSNFIHIVHNKIFCHHARGLRIGIQSLKKIEQNLENTLKSNVLMICDTDIIFRNPDTISTLATVFEEKKAFFAGELRYSDHACPQAQASFLCIRRDSYERKDINPLIYHGSPAYWMQRSLWKAGLYLYDFRSNFSGFILHRGRSGVAAAKKHSPLSTFATTKNNSAHFMGVKNGKHIWQSIEEQHADMLKMKNEDKLIDYLSRAFEA